MDIFLLFLLIVLNGLFALSEIALVTARKSRLQKLIDKGDKSAAIALKLGEQPTHFLSTLQIGITSISVLNGILGNAVLAKPLSSWLVEIGVGYELASHLATLLVVVLITYFSIVVGELVPKRIGQMFPETLSRLVARPIEALAVLTKPFVTLLTTSTRLILHLFRIKDTDIKTVTEEEIHALLEEGTSAGVIESHEHDMVRNVFRLDDRQIGSLMVPKSDVMMVDINRPFADNVALLELSPYARFPLVKGDLANVVGVLHARKFLAALIRDGDISNFDNMPLQQAVYVPETLTGMELLDTFKTSDVEMAFVVDEYGEVLGIVTLQDLIEAITGEFEGDTNDSWAVKREDDSWLLDGHIPIPELKDRLHLEDVPEEERGRYNTLSGMLMLLTGKVPRVGEKVEWGQWSFEIVDLDGKTIDKVLATPLPSPALPLNP